ncbi:alkyldihydroxyacetonephosphate synthase-like [Adelges cooleyi]|uniref:alkyldihydroxyacetonephosphate synthase-like n=1 Tax=Adelges cooleyi TaxID=133065 RepID=UPI00217F4E2B|nr:alkyldihydroxyacetonephosphate synthase-like [Adelges cooleyi]XP_050422435.1 alkyldihydroxyacetonephosphate synthase-like [Adelges cooleyi]XP_050422436.1 alkyldihydroxyacetonephosphate synthase-like [Adelges cooleyi]XP_050422437.1 alkyldihydroxyacetonephosphate synthase-like [Adelges cooleyi]
MCEKETEVQSQIVNIESVIPKNRLAVLKWNGWGYKDSKFQVTEKGIIRFTGNRYAIGETDLPFFTQWVQEVLNIDLNSRNVPRNNFESLELPLSIVPDDFLNALKTIKIDYTVDDLARLSRSHGQTLYDIYSLQHGKCYPRISDIVVWPRNHEEVVNLVDLVNHHDVVLIPFGGGTSVSGAVTCPENEKRCIVIVDTSQMNRLLWLDESNLLACFEAGIIGQDMERELRKQGYTCGHEPDSYEFSSLGGWVATRASGMKKNVYGNIEDLVIDAKMVTPKGVLEKNSKVPRMSCGPDFQQIIFGSEGTLGIITEVAIKIRPLPKCSVYNSVIFPNFESGVKCMREVARQRCQPASIRLMDNTQFKFGQALRPVGSIFGNMLDILKRKYLTGICGFRLDSVCVMTLLFEGTRSEVDNHKNRIFQIAASFNGVIAGEKNGERGYMLTFVIAYIRDLALEYNVVAESFETSVPWNNTILLCNSVKKTVENECKKLNIQHYLISCRVTQTYDTGCCVYFYFGFNWTGLDDPVLIYHHIESAARDTIIASGGSISHHHGVGKLRAHWYKKNTPKTVLSLYSASKKNLDPKNVFAVGNLITFPLSKL